MVSKKCLDRSHHLFFFTSKGDANFDCSFSMGSLICTARGRYLTVLGHEGKTELQMSKSRIVVSV